MAKEKHNLTLTDTLLTAAWVVTYGAVLTAFRLAKIMESVLSSKGEASRPQSSVM